MPSDSVSVTYAVSAATANGKSNNDNHSEFLTTNLILDLPDGSTRVYYSQKLLDPLSSQLLFIEPAQ